MITENSNDNKEFIYPNYVIAEGTVTKEDGTKKMILDAQTWVRKQHAGKWFLHTIRIGLESTYIKGLTETENDYRKALLKIELINAMNRKAYDILINAEYIPDINNGDFIITIPLDLNQESEHTSLANINNIKF